MIYLFTFLVNKDYLLLNVDKMTYLMRLQLDFVVNFLCESYFYYLINLVCVVVCGPLDTIRMFHVGMRWINLSAFDLV